MSAKIEFSRSELVQIQTSWSYIQASNKYHKDKFIFRLYSNLLAANTKLKKILSSEKRIREDSIVFGELLSFVITFLQDETRLDSFFSRFCEENENFVINATSYLEPMGQALVQTCEQWLGRGKFDEELETLWVKLYIFVANSLLQNYNEVSDSTDAESTFSQNDSLKESEESDNDGISPLNIKHSSTIKPVQQSILKKSISFDLSSNEKYKGFRRNVQFDPEPISIEIPQESIFEKVNKFVKTEDEELVVPPRRIPEANFDPRRTSKSRSMSSLNELPPEVPPKDNFTNDLADDSTSEIQKDVITPMNVVKNLKIEKQESKVVNPRHFKFRTPSKVVYDSSDEEDGNETKFDPRKLKNKRPSFTVKKKTEPEEITKKELPNITDSIFTEIINYDTQDEKVKIPERSVRRVPSIANQDIYSQMCLDPILESDIDDTTSSKYSSDDDDESSDIIAKSESDDASSGVSTLSLHNYKSSLSSGTEHSESPKMTGKYTFNEVPTSVSQVNEFNFIRSMNDLPLSRTYTNGSTSSLLLSKNRNSSQARVSLGFMRSSFVLKKEMEQLGYNLPENIGTIKTTQSMSNLQHINNKSYASVGSATSDDDDTCFDLLNSFAPPKFSTRENIKGKPCNSTCSKSRLHSITSKSKSYTKSNRNSPWNYESREIEPPKAHSRRRFSISSLFSRNSSRSSRKTSSSSRSTADAQSVYTVGTTNTNLSSFSFFSKRIFSHSSVAVDSKSAYQAQASR